jgi:hypothetical protein
MIMGEWKSLKRSHGTCRYAESKISPSIFLSASLIFIGISIISSGLVT